MKELRCYACGHHWSFEPPISRGEECPSCQRDAKVCRNCQFFDTTAHHDCRESQAEWVKDKESRNFCSYFTVKTDGFSSSMMDSSKDVLSSLENLFKKKS